MILVGSDILILYIFNSDIGEIRSPVIIITITGAHRRSSLTGSRGWDTPCKVENGKMKPLRPTAYMLSAYGNTRNADRNANLPRTRRNLRMYMADPNAIKYLVTARINADGVVDKPDVVGAIFGQTEGLLGDDLDLRDLQKNGRIGRIEVDVAYKGGKSDGVLTMSSSLDQVETSIISAALETIDRVGPCKASVRVIRIEDVRVSKRERIAERAKELLGELMEQARDTGAGMSNTLRASVQVDEITTYGKERLPAGPAVKDSDAIIIVEGRSDVLNLLKAGIKNAIAVEGTNIPKTIQDLSRERVATAFVDGDRGGELILRELFQTSEIDFVARAPRSQEVEELTAKALVKCLKNKVPGDQYMQMNNLHFEETELPDRSESPARSDVVVRRADDQEDSDRSKRTFEERRARRERHMDERRDRRDRREERRERRDRDSEDYDEDFGSRRHRRGDDDSEEEPRREHHQRDYDDEEPRRERRERRDRDFGDEDRRERRERRDRDAENDYNDESPRRERRERRQRDYDEEERRPRRERSLEGSEDAGRPAPAEPEEPAAVIEESVTEVETVEEVVVETPVEEPVAEEPVTEEAPVEEPKEEAEEERIELRPNKRNAKPSSKNLTAEQDSLRNVLKEIIGTHNAAFLNSSYEVIGKIQVKELADSINGGGAPEGTTAVVSDGVIGQRLVDVAA